MEKIVWESTLMLPIIDSMHWLKASLLVRRRRRCRTRELQTRRRSLGATSIAELHEWHFIMYFNLMTVQCAHMLSHHGDWCVKIPSEHLLWGRKMLGLRSRSRRRCTTGSGSEDEDEVDQRQQRTRTRSRSASRTDQRQVVVFISDVDVKRWYSLPLYSIAILLTGVKKPVGSAQC